MSDTNGSWATTLKPLSFNNSISVLGGFGLVLSKMSKVALELNGVSEMIKGINNKVQQIVKPIADLYSSDTMESLKILSNNLGKLSNPKYMNCIKIENQEELSQIGNQISQCITPELLDIPRMDLEAIGMADAINKVALSIDRKI